MGFPRSKFGHFLLSRFSFRAWILIIVAGGIAGCANIRTAQLLEPHSASELSHDEVIVFGRILFVGNGQKLYPYEKNRPRWIIQQRPGKNCREWPGKNALRFPFLNTDVQGNFYYAIPPGHYVMDYVQPHIFSETILPYLEFDLPYAGVAYYLGVLLVDVDMRSPLFGAVFGTELLRLNKIEVIDHFDQDQLRFKEDFPEIEQAQVHKALMMRIAGCSPEIRDPGSRSRSFIFPFGFR